MFSIITFFSVLVVFHNVQCQSSLSIEASTSATFTLETSASIYFDESTSHLNQTTTLVLNASLSTNLSQSTIGLGSIPSPITLTSSQIQQAASTTPTHSIQSQSPQSSSVITTTTTTTTTTSPDNTTTTIKPTTSFNTKCQTFTSWNPDVYLRSILCVTHQCVQTNSATFDLYLECNSRVNKDEPQLIAYKMTQYLLLRAEEVSRSYSAITALRERINEKVRGVHFVGELGVMKKSFFIAANLVTIEFSGDGIMETIQFPPNVLENNIISYQCTVFTDIYNPVDNFLYWKEPTALRKALSKLPPSITNPAPKKDIGYQINSNIVYFTLSPAKAKFEDYVLFKFKFRDPKGTTNHRCVRFHHGVPEFWSDAGCYVHQKEEDYIYCRCDTIVGRYAIISDLAIKPSPPPKLKRDSISMALYAISGFGIAAALASMLLPKLFKCQHLGGMLKIYRAADITFIVYCGVVLLSVMKSEDTGMAKLIAALLHFLHHASAIWFIVEGVHLYHEMAPLYSSAIGMMFFYSTLAFGTSAALAGAATGYSYTFSGKTQFLWAYAPGADAVFMLIPTVGIILMQIAFDVLLIWELMSWIGSKYDYLYTRSVTFIRRCTGYIFVYAITHMIGIMAMSNQESSTYAWLFIGFYGIETICLFYHHCASNVECWTWKELQDFKKELEQAEDTDSDLSSDESDESSDEEDDEKIGKRRRGRKIEKNPETIINMEEDSEGKEDLQLRRKSEFSVSSQLKLIRSDSSCSANDEVPTLQGSQTAIRESPRIEEGFENDDEPANKEIFPVEGDRPGAPEPDQNQQDSADQDHENPVENPSDQDRPAVPLPDQDRPASQASIASTVSNQSAMESDTEEKEEVEKPPPPQEEGEKEAGNEEADGEQNEEKNEEV